MFDVYNYLTDAYVRAGFTSEGIGRRERIRIEESAREKFVDT